MKVSGWLYNPATLPLWKHAGTHCIWDCVQTKASLDTAMPRKIHATTKDQTSVVQIVASHFTAGPSELNDVVLRVT
jgi:hypothetical protein